MPLYSRIKLPPPTTTDCPHTTRHTHTNIAQQTNQQPTTTSQTVTPRTPLPFLSPHPPPPQILTRISIIYSLAHNSLEPKTKNGIVYLVLFSSGGRMMFIRRSLNSSSEAAAAPTRRHHQLLLSSLYHNIEERWPRTGARGGSHRIAVSDAIVAVLQHWFCSPSHGEEENMHTKVDMHTILSP